MRYIVNLDKDCVLPQHIRRYDRESISPEIKEYTTDQIHNEGT